ncbi:MAG: hypothetical protein ACK5PG_06090 [Lysobacterales bacterium]
MSTIIIITPPPVRSRIYASERTPNTERKFGSGASYYCAHIDDGDTLRPLLFTEDQIAVALERAMNNPEDVAPAAPMPFSHWLRKQFGLL